MTALSPLRIDDLILIIYRRVRLEMAIGPPLPGPDGVLVVPGPNGLVVYQLSIESCFVV